MAGTDLRPDLDQPVDYDLLPCPDCGRHDCVCEDGPSYLVESYEVWDLVGTEAF